MKKSIVTSALFLSAGLVAFSSFVQELVLAQTLSATLGGTLLRYTTTIGLFAFSLGGGAFVYAWVSARMRHLRQNRILIFCALQVLMAVVGALGPRVVMACDPLAHESHFWLWEFLSYAPVVVVGFVSGFELPLLMDLAPSRKSGLRVLAGDYLGMFTGSVCFPLLLLPAFGVFGAAVFAAICNLVALLLVPFFRGTQQTTVSTEQVTPPPEFEIGFSRRSALVLIVVTAFCSMCYEFLIAKLLSDFGSDDVLSQSWTIGTFLLGLGLGAWWCARRTRVHPLRLLLKIEIALTVFGALTAVIIYSSATLFELVWLDRASRAVGGNNSLLWISLFQPFALFIGVLSGFELPLLLRSRPLANESGAGIPIACSYVGGLIAGFAVPLLLLPALGSMSTVVVIAMINFVCCLFLVRPAGIKWSSLRVGWLIPGSLAIGLAANLGPKVQQAYLKTHYVEIRLFDFSPRAFEGYLDFLKILGPVQRIETPYQSIDLVDESVTRAAPGFGQDFSLYLNKQPQFSRSSLRSYHESFAHGAIHLRGKTPRSVLILGGGDGLIAGELLRHKEIELIKMVELDSQMIELSKNDARIASLNHNAFLDPRVHVVIDDAFRFVRTSQEKFDAIYIDLPYPVSFDLAKLFSVEFYRAVRERISPQGYAVMDAPIWKVLNEPVTHHPQPHEVLLSTVAEAGFKTRFPYGPIEPLLYVEVNERAVRFEHPKLPEWISNRGFVNMNDIDYITGDGQLSKDYVNSVFHPRRFE